MQPDEQKLQELVQRIVAAVHPLRIILFGSAARGDMGPNSDLDVLVVMPDGVHRRKTAQSIYRHLRGFGFAKDIVVATQSDITKYRSNPYMIIKPALDEGRELYHAIERDNTENVSGMACTRKE
ncbi:MAG: nucleotidyltransferase domain-containing protein [candidate division KSB1 bacterium]|nr:nucleotidyltransferase domain-containing protein [candidate division KSB1 bacterium]MDZ7364962.1 nucleotidyltransferase domain-containing protein [candidate division KSB1 bacterium]MDZ7403357.1 nucleotidyltransferase domain-containing protein [candidate division KSB1 bacterium]